MGDRKGRPYGATMVVTAPKQWGRNINVGAALAVAHFLPQTQNAIEPVSEGLEKGGFGFWGNI
jgi:hypothetical protein